MPKMLQVRNVPDRLHRELRRRAARQGKTLSRYVLEELEIIAEELPLDDWLDEVRKRPAVRLRTSPAEAIRRQREGR
jgi:plasmid stability protein